MRIQLLFTNERVRQKIGRGKFRFLMYLFDSETRLLAHSGLRMKIGEDLNSPTFRIMI